MSKNERLGGQADPTVAQVVAHFQQQFFWGLRPEETADFADGADGRNAVVREIGRRPPPALRRKSL
jgi:hypothetical protein